MQNRAYLSSLRRLAHSTLLLNIIIPLSKLQTNVVLNGNLDIVSVYGVFSIKKKKIGEFFKF